MDRNLVGLSILFFLAFVAFTGYVYLNNRSTNSVARATNIDATISANNSLVFAWPLTVPADNTTESKVTVFVRNTAGQGIPGKNVRVLTSIGTVKQDNVITDDKGQAEFGLVSDQPGVAAITVVSEGTQFDRSVTVKFE
ncbi:Ig-like domain-containing protein [Candidatus Woesebacteria bacterium]|nr:Ig-like domain-containing protein [Candidatus Woesebacteria bacterium]